MNSRSAIATALFLVFSDISPAAAQDTDYCADLRARLPAAIAGISKSSVAPSAQNLRPWLRPEAAVNIGTVAFVPPLPLREVAKPHGPHIGKTDCGNKLINAFEVQGTTYSLTLGWSRDVCDGNPEMRWEDMTGKRERAAFPKAYASNIEAVWCLKDYLAFGLGMWHNSYIRQSDAVGLWDLRTGDFQFAPLELTEMRYPGKWQNVLAGEANGAVVFRSSASAFAFWPGKHASAPLNLTDWTSLPRRESIDDEEIRQLLPELLTREFVKAYSALTEVRPRRAVPLTLAGKRGKGSYYCACAEAEDPDHINFDSRLSFAENSLHDQVGCFIISRARPAKVLTLAIEPTRRWRDYAASCSQGEAENEVILNFAGDTYGDQRIQKSYTIDVDAWKAALSGEFSSD